jgi:hypothetical protein
MAPKKGLAASPPIAGILAGAKALAARIPFLPKRPASTPEPFAAIEDDTPLGDLLSSANAAPGMALKGDEAERPDLRELARTAAASAAKNPQALAAIFIVLGLVLAVAITAAIVASPPAPTPIAAPFTRKGEALVKTWLLPPGDPLESRMVPEREGAPAYTAQDASRIGLSLSPLTMAGLREKSDAAIDDLYGTAP